MEMKHSQNHQENEEGRERNFDYGRLLQHYNLLKHNSSPEEYHTKIVNDIVFDERKRVVSLFKDYLLLDEINDFLKRFYSLKESKSRIPKIYEYYIDFIPYVPSYARIGLKNIMVRNIKRKRKVTEYLKSPDEEEKYSTFLKSVLMKSSFEKTVIKDDLSLDYEIEKNKSQIETQRVIKNFSLLENTNPFIKRKEISLSNISVVSYNTSDSSIFKALDSIYNKNLISASQNFTQVQQVRQNDQLIKNKKFDTLESLENNLIKPFQMLDDDNKSVTRILNLSQLEMLSQNNDKTKDEDIHRNLIKRVVVNKRAIMKKKQMENLNKQIKDYNLNWRKSPSRRVDSKQKINKTNLKEAYGLFSQNYKTQSNNINIVDYQNQVSTESQNIPMFKKPIVKQYLNTSKMNTVRNTASSTMKSDIFRNLSKASNSNQNFNIKNVHSGNNGNNFNNNLTCRKETNPVTINIMSKNGSKEKDRPVYNISVNVNFNVNVTNNMTNIAPRKLDNIRKYHPMSPISPKINSKVRLLDNAFNSESSVAFFKEKEDGMNLTTNMSYRSAIPHSNRNFYNNTSKNNSGFHKGFSNKKIPKINKDEIQQEFKSKTSKSCEKKLVSPGTNRPTFLNYNSNNFAPAPWKAILNNKPLFKYTNFNSPTNSIYKLTSKASNQTKKSFADSQIIKYKDEDLLVGKIKNKSFLNPHTKRQMIIDSSNVGSQNKLATTNPKLKKTFPAIDKLFPK